MFYEAPYPEDRPFWWAPTGTLSEQDIASCSRAASLDRRRSPTPFSRLFREGVGLLHSNRSDEPPFRDRRLRRVDGPGAGGQVVGIEDRPIDGHDVGVQKSAAGNKEDDLGARIDGAAGEEVTEAGDGRGGLG